MINNMNSTKDKLKMKSRNYKWMLVALCAAIACMTTLSSCGNDDEDVKKEPTEWTGTISGHDYVDLGLPSGTLWATCNIGANRPEDYGDYFAWGEISGYKAGKTSFDWSNYKWCNGSSYSLTKYNNNSRIGYTDDLTELERGDDAAYVNWGVEWRMPSKTQQEELEEKCTWIWTIRNGKNGYKVVGPNGNSLFLPAAGIRYSYDETLYYEGSKGLYWSRTVETLDGFYFYAYGLGPQSDTSLQRCNGQSVRPVIAFQ